MGISSRYSPSVVFLACAQLPGIQLTRRLPLIQANIAPGRRNSGRGTGGVHVHDKDSAERIHCRMSKHPLWVDEMRGVQCTKLRKAGVPFLEGAKPGEA